MSELLESFFRLLRLRKTIGYLPISREKLLDLGCGCGYLLKRSDFKYKVGIDRHTTKMNFCTYIKRDITKKLPFKSNYFDCITMLAVFEHIEEDKIKSVISECYRVLRKNGRLIIMTPTPPSDYIIQFLGKLHLVHKKSAEEHKKTYYRSGVVNILKEAGFDKSKIHASYFEFFMNIVVYADK